MTNRAAQCIDKEILIWKIHDIDIDIGIDIGKENFEKFEKKDIDIDKGLF